MLRAPSPEEHVVALWPRRAIASDVQLRLLGALLDRITTTPIATTGPG